MHMQQDHIFSCIFTQRFLTHNTLLLIYLFLLLFCCFCVFHNYELWETRFASFSSYRGSRQGLVQARTLARCSRKWKQPASSGLSVYLNNPLIVRNNSLRLAPSYYEGLPQLLRSFVSPLLWIRESIIYLILFRIRLYNTLLIMSIPFPEVDKTFIFLWFCINIF